MKFPLVSGGGGGMSNLTVNATETLNKWLITLSIPLNILSKRDHIVKYFLCSFIIIWVSVVFCNTNISMKKLINYI